METVGTDQVMLSLATCMKQTLTLMILRVGRGDQICIYPELFFFLLSWAFMGNTMFATTVGLGKSSGA